jgi:SpoVK/Ycf46/Vps4 family AAA+-type ATPase
MEKLLLDNNTNHNDRSSVTTRMRCMLIQIIDRLKLDKHSVLENLLVIGTVQSRDDDLLGRFDKYFELGDPDWEERYQIIKLSFALKEVYLDEDASKMLSSAVTSLMGKSRGEIALCCRDAMNNATVNDDIDDLTSSRIRLESLHISLQNVTPESLKQLSSDESIEMRVYSSTELQSYLDFDDNGKVVFPLYGENANMAWRQLQNTIIVPLCRWQELDQLMYGDEGQDNLIMQKSITCGALLTGAPGSGKTAIVYHCAAIAARIEPTIRLLDVSCTSLISKEVGGSEKNIGRLFKTAQSAAPCIILLDGIENIAPLRGNDNTTEGTMDRLLSTLLIEMDGVKNDSTGVDDSNKRIAVIGVTHNPVSLIDPAMLRPGRLDKCIHMGYPDESARVEIIERELNDLSIEFSNTRHGVPKDVTELCEYLASKTESAADLISLSKNARISAVRDAIEGNELTIRVDHFLAVANN